MPENVVFDAKEAAAYLRISYWSTVTRAKKGLIPSFTIGSRVLFRKDTLDEWMRTREQARQPKREKIRRVM